MKDNLYYSENTRKVLAEYRASSSNIRTATEYISVVNLICTYINKDFLALTVEDAERYFAKLHESVSLDNLTRRTFCLRLSACKSISKYIEETHPELGFESPFNYIVRPSVNAAINIGLVPSLEELDKIMSSARKSSEMDYLIFALATRMCLSASNILRVTRNSITIKNGEPYLLVMASATSTKPPRYVSIPDDVWKLLQSYLANCRSDLEGHIFLNDHGKVLSQRLLDYHVKKIVKNSGIDKPYSLKDLRNHGILELFDAPASKDDISDYVGLGSERADAYAVAARYISKKCVPELVNYRLNV